MRPQAHAAVLLVAGALAWGVSPSPARALDPLKPICSTAGFVNGLIGKACTVAQHGGRLLSAGKKLLGGHVGGAVKSVLGGGGGLASTATTALALAAIGTWVFGGAKFVLHETSTVLGQTTAPQLTSTWFSSTYWRVAGIAAVLTLPFLFAAGVQALVQSDITLLARAAVGYLPLAMLAVAIAAPLTMLLLAASDQLAAIVSSAAGDQSAQFLDRASGLVGALTAFSRSPFLAFFVGLLTVAGAVLLWIELLMRAAAVYVVVLMLPLAFAAFVWPARRVWAVRAIELLVALVLSKFAIVAVLSLGGAALSHSAGRSIAGMLAGVVLLALGAFAPWALLRLLPLTEIATGAAGSLRGESRGALAGMQHADAWASEAHDWGSRAAQMRREADETEPVPAAAAETERLGALEAAVPADRAPATDPPGAPAASSPGSSPTAAGSSSPAGSSSSPASTSSSEAAPPEEAHGDGAGRGERIPGLPSMWQAQNGAWRVLTLGPGDSQVWPPDGENAGPDAQNDPASADDPDPGPPPQDPPDGRL